MRKKTGRDLWEMYYHSMPGIIFELIQTEAMKRLKGIAMHCGCNYTKIPIQRTKFYYNRFDHSVGTALIVWRFTKDIRQSIAALFHDIATPAFSHVIDFVNSDYETQESTEEYTRDFIEKSTEIMQILEKYDIDVDDVCDYHRYPIADNDSPKLSADRLEYTLSGAYAYGFSNLNQIAKIIDDLVIVTNEANEPEIGFKHISAAVEFFNICMQCSRVYVADETRLAMQYLAELISLAIDEHALSIYDLYKTEEFVIDKLKLNETTARCWKDFTKLKRLQKERCANCFSAVVPAKKRYIMPLCNGIRIEDNSNDIKKAVQEFIKLDFGNELYIKCDNSLAE